MTSTEEDIVKQLQYKSSLEMILDRDPRGGRRGPIRGSSRTRSVG